MKSFSYNGRQELLGRIENEQYDVIIIGGGITGTGIALDCSMRGLNTLLIEMQDFAAGTSSRSTKLVHGGLRYLKQFEVGMVAEVGKEREIVYRNAPHVTHPEWMLLPIYRKGTFGKYSTSLGLKVYDFLAGVKKKERRKMLTDKEALQREPLLNKKGLLGAGYYVEYRTDDARLTIEVAKTAFMNGVDLLNYVKAESFTYDTNGKISGVYCKDTFTERRYHVSGKKIINATGPWVENVIRKDRTIEGKSLFHSKGVHIVIDSSKFPLKQAVYFDTPDGRMVFAIPRNGKTYVGTTDTEYHDDLIHPEITQEDKEYLLESIAFMFPKVQLGLEDIESAWAGVRPLIREEGKGPSEISRKDEIWTSETGLITIAGGKLTGYRKMAETVTNMVYQQLRPDGMQSTKSVTKHVKLSGGNFEKPEDYSHFIHDRAEDVEKIGISITDAMTILATYGTNTDAVIRYADKLLKETNLPLSIKLTLHYAIEEEMAITPSDYFIRRTGAVLFDIDWVNKWKKEVIQYMAILMRWSDEEQEKHWIELERRIWEAGESSERPVN
ncbi:glycerol-3-phosphate dehydrogenase/oxidase [Sporosarcina sp. ACRSL]|uniref:glycerol-3-phosphate dehydrogenase/oxidase n=1 Tax=Sporosarcina sp. ACRSL TaxID=2918215 RepID=UPI001EF47A39|nr:FAD-dependent oxidoreductase [Sporosarcina sp. ACRSL]MCG7344110.1 glycerol-3-phosphate dehydrogenase/oxidase [Sporosarcina sp. ACRSL]